MQQTTQAARIESTQLLIVWLYFSGENETLSFGCAQNDKITNPAIMKNRPKCVQASGEDKIGFMGS